MATTGKLMSVKEEQALVFRERNLYKIKAEDWALMKLMEVETHMKESHVSKKLISFCVKDGKLFGFLHLILAQSVDPGTVVARFAIGVRRRGAAGVSRLLDEPRCELMSIGDNNANPPADKFGRVIRVKHGCTMIVGRYIFLEAYSQEAFLKKHLVDGQLLIEVDLEVTVGKEQLGKSRDRRETFTGQIGSLSDHHDYKLVCGEDEFPCHKAVLAARSPVVARGLAQGEHLGRSVREAWEVKDTHPAAVKALLAFIYTAEVPNMEEEGMAVEVLKLADFFEMLELKAAATDEIILQLSTSNALRALVELDLHVKEGGGAARGVVLGYIMEHITQVVASEDWGEFVKSGYL